MPPKPKLDTAARRGPFDVHGVASRAILKGECASSSVGLSSSHDGCGGMVRWYSASVALMKPATPAADMVWPMLALMLDR